jgi:DNA gyrase inhibitor GyrI
MFENRVLRFIPKRDEIKEGWRKLYNVWLHNAYALPTTNCFYNLNGMHNIVSYLQKDIIWDSHTTNNL